MGVIDTLKEVGGLVNKIGNLDLTKQILSLQTEVLSLVEDNHGLKEDIRALKSRLATREELKFIKNAYWAGEDGPFCSPCWDNDGKQIRLHISSLERGSPQCPVCKHYAIDPDKHRTIHQRQREDRLGSPRGGRDR